MHSEECFCSCLSIVFYSRSVYCCIFSVCVVSPSLLLHLLSLMSPCLFSLFDSLFLQLTHSFSPVIVLVLCFLLFPFFMFDSLSLSLSFSCSTICLSFCDRSSTIDLFSLSLPPLACSAVRSLLFDLCPQKESHAWRWGWRSKSDREPHRKDRSTEGRKHVLKTNETERAKDKEKKTKCSLTNKKSKEMHKGRKKTKWQDHRCHHN